MTAPAWPNSYVALDEVGSAWMNANRDAILYGLAGAIVCRGFTMTNAGAITVAAVERFLINGTNYTKSGTTAVTSGLSGTEVRYIYAWINAGNVDFECVTTAPDASYYWKTGAVGTHRYIGAVSCVGGSEIPCSNQYGVTMFDIANLAAQTDITQTKNASGAQTVSLSGIVPPTARAIRFSALATLPVTAGANATLRIGGNAGGTLYAYDASIAPGGYETIGGTLAYTGSTVQLYDNSTAGANVLTITFTVLGYEEW